MEYLAIAFGLAALFTAWRNGQAAKALQERLDSVNNRYFTLVNQVRESEEATQRELMDLRVEMKRQAGLLKFEPQMTIAETYAMHPRAAEVLAGFHLGGCSSCAVSSDETLAGAARQHNLNLDMMLGALRQLAAGNNGGSTQTQMLPHGLTTDPDLRIIA
jgi:hybrid cluster-associated redox disulfide protein